jgi:hypothetical protein
VPVLLRRQVIDRPISQDWLEAKFFASRRLRGLTAADCFRQVHNNELSARELTSLALVLLSRRMAQVICDSVQL